MDILLIAVMPVLVSVAAAFGFERLWPKEKTLKVAFAATLVWPMLGLLLFTGLMLVGLLQADGTGVSIEVATLGRMLSVPGLVPSLLFGLPASWLTLRYLRRGAPT